MYVGMSVNKEINNKNKEKKQTYKYKNQLRLYLYYTINCTWLISVKYISLSVGVRGCDGMNEYSFLTC